MLWSHSWRLGVISILSLHTINPFFLFLKMKSPHTFH
nr:MAG TPA: hypothetical protein [Caudoviricetes sp.]